MKACNFFGIAKQFFVVMLFVANCVSRHDQKCALIKFFTYTGTPPLTRFCGPRKNCVKGKPHYRRSILVLKPKNGEYESSKSTFSRISNFFSLIFSTIQFHCGPIIQIDCFHWKKDDIFKSKNAWLNIIGSNIRI